MLRDQQLHAGVLSRLHQAAQRGGPGGVRALPRARHRLQRLGAHELLHALGAAGRGGRGGWAAAAKDVRSSGGSSGGGGKWQVRLRSPRRCDMHLCAMLNRLGGAQTGAVLVGIGRAGQRRAPGAAEPATAPAKCPHGCLLAVGPLQAALTTLCRRSKLLGALAGHAGRLTSVWSCNKLRR